MKNKSYINVEQTGLFADSYEATYYLHLCLNQSRPTLRFTKTPGP